MRRLVKSSFIACALALIAAPAPAQMTVPKGVAHHTAGGKQAMMSDCSAMMQEVMADPIVRKRMMVIMQKHMQGHAGQGSMMMPGMQGGNTMQGGNAGNGSPQHYAHHPAGSVATPIPSTAPMPTPSP